MNCPSCKRRFGEHNRDCVVRQIDELFMDIIIDIGRSDFFEDAIIVTRLHDFIDAPAPSTPIKEAI